MTFRSQKLIFATLLGFAAAIAPALQTLDAQETDKAKQAKQAKQLNQAMGFKPKFASELVYEQPNAAVLKGCIIERMENPPGFIVYHETGRVLRKFVDTNKDKNLDQWSYYNEGLEVYRDIDSNFDENLDQYRWLGPAGTRWGIDRDQDGEIDYWKVISPEEVAYECFQAVKKKDAKRFNRLLLSEDELKALGLNEAIFDDASKRWNDARSNFPSMAKSQKAISSNSKWVYAGNGQPSMMADSMGNKKNLVIYDHASGFFENGSSPQQIALGSIVKVGEGWRLVELPEIVDPKQPLENGGVFFPREDRRPGGTVPDKFQQQLAERLGDLTKAEELVKSAKGVAVERAEKARADVLVKLVGLSRDMKDAENLSNWQMNLADSVCDAYQNDRFDGGIDYLNKYMIANKGSKGLDYIKWRSIFAEFAWVDKNGSKKQVAAAREKFNGELKAFQKSFPNSEFAPKALIQLAVHYEVNDSDEPAKATEWYRECVSRFPNTTYGKRAKGALIRLNNFGKTFPLVGKTASGQDFNIERLKGKIVVLHFWETWCFEESDIKDLARLQSKFKDDLVIVGCNIEGSTNGGGDAEATKEFRAFLARNKSEVTWIQLHAPGSVDRSPLAHQLGIATEPTIVLVDREGKLVETNISISALEREIVREKTSLVERHRKSRHQLGRARLK